jgi:hypothetical protein
MSQTYRIDARVFWSFGSLGKVTGEMLGSSYVLRFYVRIVYEKRVEADGMSLTMRRP